MSAIDGNFVYQKTLSCGRIEVSSEETDYPLTDLFDIAERRNQNAHFCLSVKCWVDIFLSLLWSCAMFIHSWRRSFPTLDGPVVFIGMAETAVGLGGSV